MLSPEPGLLMLIQVARMLVPETTDEGIALMAGSGVAVAVGELVRVGVLVAVAVLVGVIVAVFVGVGGPVAIGRGGAPPAPPEPTRVGQSPQPSVTTY
jgi:hypothetical protein